MFFRGSLVRTINKGKGHAEVASEIIKGLGYPKIANLISKHAFEKVGELKTWEEKILYYADKRVEGESLTTLRKRLKKTRERAVKEGASKTDLSKIEKKILSLEMEIKEVIG